MAVELSLGARRALDLYCTSLRPSTDSLSSWGSARPAVHGRGWRYPLEEDRSSLPWVAPEPWVLPDIGTEALAVGCAGCSPALSRCPCSPLALVVEKEGTTQLLVQLRLYLRNFCTVKCMYVPQTVSRGRGKYTKNEKKKIQPGVPRCFLSVFPVLCVQAVPFRGAGGRVSLSVQPSRGCCPGLAGGSARATVSALVFWRCCFVAPAGTALRTESGKLAVNIISP